MRIQVLAQTHSEKLLALLHATPGSGTGAANTNLLLTQHTDCTLPLYCDTKECNIELRCEQVNQKWYRLVLAHIKKGV
jgi:hypothetical protein